MALDVGYVISFTAITNPQTEAFGNLYLLPVQRRTVVRLYKGWNS